MPFLHHCRAVLTSALIVLCASTYLIAQTSTDLGRQYTQVIQPLLKQHCGNCHSGAVAEAMLDLDKYGTTEQVAAGYQTWAELRSRVAKSEMPPADAKTTFTADHRAALINWIDAFRKSEAEKHAGEPGHVPVRRLTNSEINYSIRDLTGVDIRPTREFPIDPANEAGFDNSADSLTMSPALLSKSLAAARFVAEHMVLTPDGVDFAPHPAVTETDRDKYCVKRIVEFYGRQRTDYADYLLAAWRIQRDPEKYTVENQSSDGLSSKYLRLVLGMLTDADAAVMPAPKPATVPPSVPDPGSEVAAKDELSNDVGNVVTQFAIGLGPLPVIRRMWLDLPEKIEDESAARAGCERLRNFIVDLRQRLEPEIRDLNVRGIHRGAQPFVLWKNDQYASNRQRPNLDALGKLAPGADSRAIHNALSVPESDKDKLAFVQDCERFCRLFPDAFYVSERGRDYVGKPKAEQEKGRLLSAGFHSMMGYYRDDEPLMKLILSPSECEHLDRLWQELDFVTFAPMRQYTGFVWFERTDSNTMRGAEFDFARAEDKSVTTPVMIERLAETYLAKADELGAQETPREAIETFFRKINAQIQRVESARRLAEPHQVQALLRFAGRAFRRDLTLTEQFELRSFYEQLRSRDGLTHEEAMQDLLVAILMSPQFNYRVDLASKPGGIAPLNDDALASRLSYFLWSSIPDEQLRSLARTGELHEPAILKAQVKRMLGDSRTRALAVEFGGQWLDFRRFEQHNSVDRERFPAFTDELRSAMYAEPVQFLQQLWQHDGNLLDCLYADYVWINAPLAAHYGYAPLTNTNVDGWQKLPARNGRGGLMTMSVFLTQNAPGRRTSPVKRGYWVVRRLLGERIPAPPPNVPDLPTDEAQLGSLTLRETLAKHREHASCAGCHNRFDSIGLAFENFGPIGELRSKDLAGNPVDVRAVFPSGEEGSGVNGLQEYLRLHRQADFVDNFCRKLLAFALGRTLLLSDEPLIEKLQQELQSHEYRMSAVIETIVLSPQFLNVGHP